MFLLEYVIPFIILFGTLVAVHEWGHYYAARSLGIHATHFAVGMGPVLWSRVDRHGTRWQICALPLGGYVRFLGDKDGTSAAPGKGEIEAASRLPEEERRRYFHMRSPKDRAFVIFAGPAVNLFVGFLLISTLYVTIGRPTVPPVVQSVVSGYPAEAAGIEAGDRILRVNGKAVGQFTEVFDEIALYPNGKVKVEVERKRPDAEPRTLAFDLQARTETVVTFGVNQTVGRIGITSGPPVLSYTGPLEAIVIGTADVYKLTKGMLVGLGQIIVGTRPLDDIGGPVRMAEMSGGAAKAGLAAFVFLIAAVSINLAIVNLLPLPALDGGQLMVCAVEALTRRQVNERVLGYVHAGGVVLLVSLMVMLTIKDVLGLIQKLSG